MSIDNASQSLNSELQAFSLGGLLFVHHSGRFLARPWSIFSVGAPHAYGFFREAQDRPSVFEDKFQPGALVHLWEIDAAEK
jgi:hypothetical protein